MDTKQYSWESPSIFVYCDILENYFKLNFWDILDRIIHERFVQFCRGGSTKMTGDN